MKTFLLTNILAALILQVAGDTLTFNPVNYAAVQGSTVTILMDIGDQQGAGGTASFFVTLGAGATHADYAYTAPQAQSWTAADQQLQFPVFLVDDAGTQDQIIYVSVIPMGGSTASGPSSATVTILAVDPALSNDPHLLLPAPGLNLPFCFDLTGLAGQVFKLIEKKMSGLTVLATLGGDSYMKLIQIKASETLLNVSTTGLTHQKDLFTWEKFLGPLRTADVIAAKLDDDHIEIKGADFALIIERAADGTTEPFLNLLVKHLDDKAEGIMGFVLTNKYEVTSMMGNDVVIAGPGGSIVAKKEVRFGRPCYAVEKEDEGVYPGRKQDYLMG